MRVQQLASARDVLARISRLIFHEYGGCIDALRYCDAAKFVRFGFTPYLAGVVPQATGQHEFGRPSIEPKLRSPFSNSQVVTTESHDRLTRLERRTHA